MRASPIPGSQVRTGADALLQTVELAVAAEEIGLDGAFLASIPGDSVGTEHAANLFGQGVVQASPLGIATMAASVAAGEPAATSSGTRGCSTAPTAPRSRTSETMPKAPTVAAP